MAESPLFLDSIFIGKAYGPWVFHMFFPHVRRFCAMAIHRLGSIGGIVASATLRSRPGGLGDGRKTGFFHHEMESFFVVSDNQPFKGMVDGDHHIPPIDISKMVKLGMVSYSNGNSRILKWSYLLVLYHISGHMNWGYIPWNLALKNMPYIW